MSDWVCGRCKSINRERAATCYSCGGVRGAIQIPTSSAAAAPSSAIGTTSTAVAEGPAPEAAASFASGIPIAEVAASVPAEPATMGDLAGGVIGGAIGAVLATALWYGVVAITNWQIGLVAIAVGFIVGQAVVFGAGRHPSIMLVPISVAFTLVSLVVSEYLIARHFLGIAAAEVAAETGIPAAEFEAVFSSPIELLRFSLESEPITLLFWAIAGWEAFIIPMRAANRANS